MLEFMAAWSIPITVISVLMCIGGIWGASWLIARLPEDHFVRHEENASETRSHFAWRIVKNIVGILLVAAGIAMLFLPGQGILAILLGISIVDLPGKHRLMVWLLERKSVRKSLNWIRRKAHKPPLQFPGRS